LRQSHRKRLPHAYKHFIETLNITSMNFELKFDEIYNKLLQQHTWNKQFSISSEKEGFEQAFVAKLKGKSKWAKKKGRSNSEDVTKDQKTIKFHYCGSYNHMKKHYRKRLDDQRTKQGGPQ